MVIPYSTDLRERVMAAVADGMTVIEAARTFSVSRDAIHDWRHRLTTTASVTPRPATGGRPRRLDAAAEVALATAIDAAPVSHDCRALCLVGGDAWRHHPDDDDATHHRPP